MDIVETETYMARIGYRLIGYVVCTIPGTIGVTRGIVLGYNAKKEQYVTWYADFGEGVCGRGHYNTDHRAAVMDFAYRVENFVA